MNDHSVLMVLFSVMVSLVFTFLTKHGIRERVKYFFLLLASFVLLSILVSWVMYPFPF